MVALRTPAALAVAAVLALSIASTAAAGPPANDAFAAAQDLGGVQGSVSGTNLEATKEPGEPVHAGNAGGRSVWFRWTAPSDGQFSWRTDGSAFDTLLAVYQGGSVTALTPVAADDDSGDESASAVSFRATRATVYVIAVDGFDGKADRFRLSWATAPANDNLRDAVAVSGLRGNIPATTRNSTREAGEPGDPESGSIWFRWTAPATGRVTFAVERGYGVVAAYTGTDLSSLSPVGRSVGDELAVRINAVAGTVYSIAILGGSDVVALAWEPPPANDTFAASRTIRGPSGHVSGSNRGAASEGGRFPSASVWYRWRAPRSGPVVFDTNGSSFDTVLAVYTGRSLRGLRLVRIDDDGGSGVASRLQFRALRGRLYTIAVGGYGGDMGSIRLNWRPNPRSGR